MTNKFESVSDPKETLLESKKSAIKLYAKELFLFLSSTSFDELTTEAIGKQRYDFFTVSKEGKIYPFSRDEDGDEKIMVYDYLIEIANAVKRNQLDKNAVINLAKEYLDNSKEQQ